MVSKNLVKRLRDGCVVHERRWSGDTHSDLGGSVNESDTNELLDEAADWIEKLDRCLENIKLLPRYRLNDLEEVMEYDKDGDFVTYDELIRLIDSALKRAEDE